MYGLLAMTGFAAGSGAPGFDIARLRARLISMLRAAWAFAAPWGWSEEILSACAQEAIIRLQFTAFH